MNLFPDEMRRDHHPSLRSAADRLSVFHVAPLDLWMVFDYDGVKRALTDHDAFSSGGDASTGKAPDWIVFSDPPRHTKLRSIVLRAFTPRSIAGLEPRIRELSRELLDP